MTFFDTHLLSIVVFLPLVGVVALLLTPRHSTTTIQWTALLTTLITFVCSLRLWAVYEPIQTGFQLVERMAWIEAWGVDYHLGIDGISLFLILLTTLLSVIAVLSAKQAISKHVREFMICLLLLEIGMNGVFLALDVFLFYVFWEVMLFPMYFLIGVWGSERRLYAAIKFVLYTMSASVLMLVAILWVFFLNYQATGVLTFSLQDWWILAIDPQAQYWLFAAFALAFAVKIPMFPVHTWLPDAHVEAPTAGSIILAGVLLKMGSYGFLRFAMPLFPNALTTALPWLMGLCVIGILYGALVCMIQADMKKLVAYSSVSHMGFVMLGIFSLNLQGMQGGVLQMLNHGISTGALFLGVGMLYERRHTKAIADYGGLIKVMPVFSCLFLLVTFSSIGLPGLNGFVGEYLILLGAFKEWPLSAVLAALAVILAAVYMLWMCQRVFFGPITHKENAKLTDLNLREKLLFTPLVGLILWIGIYPEPFLMRMEPAVKQLQQLIETKYHSSLTAVPKQNQPKLVNTQSF